MKNITIHLFYYTLVMLLCVCDIYTGRIFSVRALLFLPLYFYIMHSATSKQQAMVFAIFVAMVWTVIDLGVDDVSPSFFLFLSLVVRLVAFGGLSVILLRVKVKQMRHNETVKELEMQRDQLHTHINRSVDGLRKPLADIQSFAQLVLDSEIEPLNNLQRNYVRNIRIVAGQLYFELSEIQDFAKIGTQKMKLQLLPYDYITTVREVITQVGLAAQKKSLQIHFDCPETRLSLNIDRHRMGQALQEILLQAITAAQYNTTLHIEIVKQKAVIQTKIYGTVDQPQSSHTFSKISNNTVRSILDAHRCTISTGSTANGNHCFEYFISFPI